MAESTHIEWADATFNGWIGCTKVSPGCAHCYAERFGKRQGVAWGPGRDRRRTSATNWRGPIRWNARAKREREAAEAAGLPAPPPPRVFSASLSDWLDPEVPEGWLRDLLALVVSTPELRWLLLTKRPELWRPRMELVASNLPHLRGDVARRGAAAALAWLRGDAPPNARPGTTIESDETAPARLASLLDIPSAHPRGRFISAEPLLGFVNLVAAHPLQSPHLSGIGWVIAGGESGPGARPMHPDWARSLRSQAQRAGIAFMLKQWGEWAPGAPGVLPVAGAPPRVLLRRAPGDLDPVPMEARGKHASGNELDGRTWLEVGP